MPKISRVSIVVAAGLLSAVSTSSRAMTYYTRPDGNDANPGTRNTPDGAWRSIDRGQPTVLAKPAKTGDTTVYLAKASQFPPQGTVRLGKTAVSYTGRNLQRLTGCTGVSDAKAGTPVICPDWPPPQPGDTVMVAGGVYSLAIEAEPLSVANIPMAVAVIRSGGTADRPVVFRGKDLPVVDGKDDTIGWAVTAPYIQIEGFDIRRGGVWVFRGKGGSLRDCRIHEGNRAVTFAYSSECEISGNIIYDFQGAWTSHGITVGSSENVTVHHNTIVSNGCAVRLYGGGHNEISHNLIAWCRVGIRFDAKKPPKDCQVHDNNIWWCGGGNWLQRDDNQGKHFYENVSPDPHGRHEEPLIVDWRSQADDFLRVHFSSPLVKDGRAWIGARRQPADYPEADNRPGENLVFNPSFEAGFLGWHLSSWEGFLPGQAGYEIVEVPGGERRKCLHLYDLPPKGRRINVRARSLNFRYTRGKPLTISFRAKANAAGTLLSVGLNVPSWQDKSGVGTKVALTTEWQIPA